MASLRDQIESTAALRRAVRAAAKSVEAVVLDLAPAQAFVPDQPPPMRLRWRDREQRDGQAILTPLTGGGWQAQSTLPAWLQSAVAHPEPLRPPERQLLTWPEAREQLDAQERALFGPWQEALHAWAGQPVQWWLQREPVPAVLLTLPPVPADCASGVPLLLRVPELWSEPGRAEWLERLGFGLDEAGECATVPTPASFRRLVAATLDRPAAFAPRLLRSQVRVLPPRQWLDHLCAGEIPIGHGTPAWYRWTAPTRTRQGLRVPTFKTMWHGHFAAVGHDMAVHALLCHRLSPAFQREAAAAIQDEVRRLRVAVEMLTPGPLLAFWEEDLHQFALRCLRDAPDVQTFDALLIARLPQLRERLGLRLSQTRQRVRGGIYLGYKHMMDAPM